MSKVTINGEPVAIPALPLMSNQQLQFALMAAALVGDLYTCAVCEIAMNGHPRTRTWVLLDTQCKQQLHREYMGPHGLTWHREHAQLEMLRRSQTGAA